MKTLYLCDGEACEKCDPTGECKHTSDVYHAKNFGIIAERCPNGELRDAVAVEKANKTSTLVISSNMIIKEEVFSKIKNDILKAYEDTGVLCLPTGFYVLKVEGDVNIKFEDDIKEENGYESPAIYDT